MPVEKYCYGASHFFFALLRFLAVLRGGCDTPRCPSVLPDVGRLDVLLHHDAPSSLPYLCDHYGHGSDLRSFSERKSRSDRSRRAARTSPTPALGSPQSAYRPRNCDARLLWWRSLRRPESPWVPRAATQLSRRSPRAPPDTSQNPSMKTAGSPRRLCRCLRLGPPAGSPESRLQPRSRLRRCHCLGSRASSSGSRSVFLHMQNYSRGCDTSFGELR